MLTSLLLAHQDGAAGLHGLWSRWNLDPVIVLSVVAAGWLYHRGAHRGRPVGARRATWFGVGLLAVVVALLSPLDGAAAELASAHMVQHVLLVVIAAPAFAYSAPMAAMLAGAPRAARRRAGRARRRFRAVIATAHELRRPSAAWLLHAGTLWFWHASVPYGAALEVPLVHALEHLTFLGTGVLFWMAIVPGRGVHRASYGFGAMLVFTMAMQSVFLAALLTFATTPWYDGYRDTTAVWGLEPLADQQLAGVIMWVPAGLVYVAVGVLLVGAWVRHDPPGVDRGGIDDWSAGPTREPLTQLSRSP